MAVTMGTNASGVLLLPWRFAIHYEYLVVTKGMSMLNSLEEFGESLQTTLNQEANAHTELGWEL